MNFKRKVYSRLLEWKEKYSDKYAVLLEGARRVGKSTIAQSFGENEYDSCILIDFSKATANILECFDDIANLNIFFLRLQAETGITLYEHKSLIIFDEVQLFPKARQAIKHLVADGRYSYLETGSLISIKKNVKDILIPSEEMKIQVYPMDYQEFCDATGGNYELLCQIYNTGKAIGQPTNRKLMRDLRIYMDYLDGHLYHFRDNVTGLEVDSILEFSDGEYAAVEIKLGYNQVEEAKKSLLKFYDNMVKKPAFMCIIFGKCPAIIKDPETGIYIVPITALKP
mgnify:CR=1 FL=1